LSESAAAPVARVDGAGPAVLLLHGQPGSGADWRGVASALRDRFTTIVPDRPGYGRTGGHALGFDGNAEAAIALLDSLDVERATVAGHSWGAGVALALAGHAPDRLAALVLICPVTPLDRLGRLDQMLASERIGKRVAYGTMHGAGLALETAPVRRAVAALLPGYDAERAPEIAREWRRGHTWRSFHVEQKALFHELPRLGDRLAAVAAPATVVVAERDHVTSPDSGRVLADRLGARVVELKGAGHLVHMREPARVAEAIASAHI
jgi:pimeloyl-ACP methyl ester carboxylesterase